MKKNKIINLILILLAIFIILLIFNNKVYASGDVISDPGFYNPYSEGSENELTQRVGVILGVINVIGVVVSVITLMIVGIKYMIGSIEEKAEYKKTMGIYLLGAFLVFSTTTIPNVLYNFASKI